MKIHLYAVFKDLPPRSKRPGGPQEYAPARVRIADDRNSGEAVPSKLNSAVPRLAKRIATRIGRPPLVWKPRKRSLKDTSRRLFSAGSYPNGASDP